MNVSYPGSRGAPAHEETKGEVHPLFFERGLSRSENAAAEREDILFLSRFGPKNAPADTILSPESAPDEGTPSALSAPENFIAEGFVRSAVHRIFGRKLRSAAVVASVVAAAVAVGIATGGSLPAILSLKRNPAPEAAVDHAGPERTAEARNGKAVARNAALPVAKADVPPPPAPPPQSAADLQSRLRASGLPEPLVSTTVSEAKVTSFPPALTAPADEQPNAGADPSGNRPPETAAEKAETTSSINKSRGDETRRLDALIARGQQLLDSGEVAAARLFFERAAAEGDARGALGVAKSYNERVLKTLPVVGLQGNSEEAERWYVKAAELEARQRGRPAP